MTDAPARIDPSRTAPSKSALIVDDSAVIRKVARRILETLDFSVRDAEDGRTALALCAQAMPSVILLDWNMPNMDGYEVLRQLRQFPSGVRPKVLFCTTENDIGAIARGRRRIHHEAFRPGNHDGQARSGRLPDAAVSGRLIPHGT